MHLRFKVETMSNSKFLSLKSHRNHGLKDFRTIFKNSIILNFEYFLTSSKRELCSTGSSHIKFQSSFHEIVILMFLESFPLVSSL